MPSTVTTERPATVVELPQHPDESARAYRARVEYVTMGEGRSLEKLRQRIGNRSVRYLEIWSSRFGWETSARQYDEQRAFITVQEALSAHRQELDDYRKRYGDMGKAIYGSAARLLTRLNKHIDTVAIGPGSLNLITNAVRMAADLEALALRLDYVLEQDTDAEHRHEQ